MSNGRGKDPGRSGTASGPGGVREKVIREREIPPEELARLNLGPSDDGLPEEELSETDRALRDLTGGSGSAYIFRIRPGVGDGRVRAGTLSWELVVKDPEIIGQSFGGDNYSVDFRRGVDDGENPAGSYGRRNVVFLFDPLMYGAPKGPGLAPAETKKPEGSMDANSMILLMLSGMMQQSQMLANAMTAAMTGKKEEAAQPSTFDTMFDKIMAAAERMKPNLPAVTGDNGLMASLTSKIVEKAIDKLGETTGSPDESPLTAIAREFAKSIGPAIGPFLARSVADSTRRRAPDGGAAPSSPAAAGSPLSPQITVAAPGAGSNGGKSRFDTIKEHPMYGMVAPMLLKMAKKNQAPADAAAEIDGMVPAAFEDVLRSVLEHPDIVTYLSTFEPELANHGPWVLKVRNELLEFFKDDEPEPEPEGEPVNEGASTGGESGGDD